jgi:hypothetical protein
MSYAKITKQFDKINKEKNSKNIKWLKNQVNHNKTNKQKTYFYVQIVFI